MNLYIPDRKVLASGLSGVLAWGVSLLLPDLPVETVTGAIGAIMLLVGYIVPPSVNDIVKRVDTTIIRLAGGDKGKPVDALTP